MADVAASNGHIQVDLSKSHLSDWALVAGAQGGIKDMSSLPAWIEFLNRVLVGGADQYPMDRLSDVIIAVSEALTVSANPRDGQGKA